MRSTMTRLALGAVCLAAATGQAAAFSDGINGWSGNPATNGGLICSACHVGGVVPIVTLIGPTSVNIGTVNTYTLRITGGQQAFGGLDVSTTAGALSVNPSEPMTYLSNGEITHMDKKTATMGTVIFRFDWTAPMTPGLVTMYGAGNSVNGDFGNGGDAPSNDVLNIGVLAATIPGETSGDGYAPLLVTGYDKATGDLDLGYQTACDATSNNIYYGALDQVSSYSWSGEVCLIGAGGTYNGFNPGPGNFFFVVVGNANGDEGSYGKDDGSFERPPFASICGQTQDLSSTCVAP